MELEWEDVVVDKEAVKTDPARLLLEWLWLVPKGAEPMLPTACGDLFLRLPTGSVAFLATYAGSCETVAPSYEQWKAMLDDPDQVEEWFRGGLVGDLLQAGLNRKPGECFSPLVPQIINELGSIQLSSLRPAGAPRRTWADPRPGEGPAAWYEDRWISTRYCLTNHSAGWIVTKTIKFSGNCKGWHSARNPFLRLSDST